MPRFALASALFGVVALAGCESAGVAGGTQLSQCMRNALVGAGVGAVLGGVTASEGRRTEGAVLGGAVGGGGTFAVCKLLDGREQARIEGAYLAALQTNSAQSESWVGGNGRSHVLQVSQPQAIGSGQCRSVTATLSIDGTSEPLPTETYCRSQGGGWTPA
jgi:hypothetical protein